MTTQLPVPRRKLKQKAADEERLQTRITELRGVVKSDLEKTARLKRTDEVAAMRKTMEAKRLAVDILRERMQKERANQQVYKGETVELEFLRSDYDSAAKVFEAINDRIVSMRLEQHAPDRVMLFKEAGAPLFPDEALPYKHMSLAAALAFAAVLYKLQVSGPARDKQSDQAADPCQDFLARFLAEIQPRLVASSRVPVLAN